MWRWLRGLRSALSTQAAIDPNDTSLGTFDPLYPLAWSFYGFHAAFDRKNLVVGGLHLEGGYKTTYFRTSYFPVMWRVQLNDGVYNSFNEIARRPDFQSRGGNFPDLPWASRDIGQQLDFGFFWQATHHIQFYATYLHFFAGQFYTVRRPQARDMNGVMFLTRSVLRALEAIGTGTHVPISEIAKSSVVPQISATVLSGRRPRLPVAHIDSVADHDVHDFGASRTGAAE